MPKSYTPNWFFTALLDNHINQMMALFLPAGLTDGFLLQERYARFLTT